MQLQTNQYQLLSATTKPCERGIEQILPQSLQEKQANIANNFDFGLLAFRTVREQILVLSHLVCDTLL